MMTKEQMIAACSAIPSKYDERDYKLEQHIAMAVPIPTEYKTKIKPPFILNQGNVGCCVGCSIAMTRYFREVMQHGSSPMLSAKWIYGNRTSTDWQGEGMEPREGLQNVRAQGVPKWDSFPGYSEYPKAKNEVLKNKAKLSSEAAKYKINKFYACSKVSEIKQGIMQFGAVTATFPADETLMNVKSDGMLNTPPSSARSKPKYGYHQMTIVGWFKDKRGILRWDVINSWGDDWGDKGHCYPIAEGTTAYPLTESWVAVDNIM